jgi:CRP-like cAMP-binding protein
VLRREEVPWIMAGRDEIVDAIASFTVFADLGRPQLEAVAGQLEESWYAAGERILRQGLSGSGLFFVLDGECSVQVDGEERAKLSRGEFFGEISVLLGESPVADVVALAPVRCLVLARPLVEPFLVANPRVTFRMLQAMGRRLRNATSWRS